jgi:VIT1/CCC1 family predicted Fe2+/Mn2+ transporter
MITLPKPASRILDPMDRISEILFGLIMVLTYTGTLAVLTADSIAIRTMIVGALGCNLAWGIIDGGVFLMARLNERGRAAMTLRAVHAAPDAAAAQQIIADAMPPLLASLLAPDQREAIRLKLQQMRAPDRHPRLTRDDWLGAIAVCLLSFCSTFPVVVPFLVIGDARLALRAANGVALAMLFGCGYAFGTYSGLRPWTTGLAMVGVGAALVAVAIALGG